MKRSHVPVLLGLVLLAGAGPYTAGLERVYKLEQNQVLKRVPRPYIPERMEWYRAEHQGQAAAIPAGPDFMVFEWTETKGLQNGLMGFGYQKVPVRHVIDGALKLNSYEFEGPDDLLSLDLAGDWVVRPEADTARKLQALAGVIKEIHGRTVHFDQRELPREVIVASGTWNFQPLKGTYDERRIHLFADKQDKDEGSGGGSGDLARFLQMLGDRVGSRVVDEVQGERPKMLSWGHHSSSRLHNLPAGPDRLEKLMLLLDNVSKQTGLKLEPARRNVPVSVMTEVKPEA
jgi:uncharacterized protein (TIGR03435 family)